MPLAALAMVGTLPGRTQGLGLITESLLRDLHVDQAIYGGQAMTFAIERNLSRG
jgi:hypothetical protein